jgi:signal transduction histidine kinase
MRERARALQGSLSVRSRPGEGTSIVVLIPLAPAGDQPGAPVPGDVVVDPLDQD